LENLRGKAIEEVDKQDTSDELPPQENARELSHTQSQKRAIKRGR
jgi:hypothetical protein